MAIFKQVSRKITTDGWVLIRVCGSHHQYKKDGNSFVLTVPNHGNKELSIGVIKNLEKITGLSLR